MKFTKLVAMLSLSLVSLNSLSQKNSIWATVENVENLQKNPQFISITVDNHMDLTYTKVFPSSKQEKLLKVYEFTCDCDVTELYTSLHKVSDLRGIEYGPTYEVLGLPNDYNVTSPTNWALDLIGAETAWSYTTGDPNLNVAVSDQNYYNNHEELIDKINFYDNTNTLNRTHGTAVATIVAGNTNNSLGLSSIGYNSTLNLYRMNFNDVLMASYAGARVINLSWASSCFYNSYVQSAIDEVWYNGTFIVAAAGNGSTCGGPDALVYPAAYNHVFAVTSVGSQDNIERTIGNPTTRHQTNSSVDISAPGFDVPITAAPGWYLTGNGTSFAAPYVTGTVALMLSLKPNLTNNQIDSILRVTATNINSINPSYVGKMGSGRLNSGMAVRVVQNIIDKENLANEDDGNNGHGNDEDGYDDSNPGQGNGNNGNGDGTGKPGSNGWAKSSIENNSTTRPNRVTIDFMGREVNLENSPSGYYFLIENGVSRKIYKY